jgi:hypothetical protein
VEDCPESALALLLDGLAAHAGLVGSVDLPDAAAPATSDRAD